MLHYVDDFFSVFPRAQAESMWKAFVVVHELLNVELEDDKSVPPAARSGDGQVTFTLEMPLLGVITDVETPLELGVAPSPERVTRVVSACEDVLRTGSAPPSAIGSLAGRLGFTAAATHGRASRAYIRPLYHAEAGGEARVDAAPGSTVAVALRWFVGNLPHLPPRRVRLRDPPTMQVLYVDASFEVGSREFGIGGVLYVPARRRATWFGFSGVETDLNLGPRTQQVLPMELL